MSEQWLWLQNESKTGVGTQEESNAARNSSLLVCLSFDVNYLFISPKNIPALSPVIAPFKVRGLAKVPSQSCFFLFSSGIVRCVTAIDSESSWERWWWRWCTSAHSCRYGCVVWVGPGLQKKCFGCWCSSNFVRCLQPWSSCVDCLFIKATQPSNRPIAH